MAERIVRRETNELRDAVKRTKNDLEKYQGWLLGFYTREHREYIAQLLKPFVDANYFTEERAQEIIDIYCNQRGDEMSVEMQEPTVEHFLRIIEE
jgi:hypothetical protein